MSQFTVHRNKNPSTQPSIPLLLDIQHDLLAELETRVVVPLCPVSALRGKALRTLTPVFEIDGDSFVLFDASASRYPSRRVGSARCAPRSQKGRDPRRPRFPGDRILNTWPGLAAAERTGHDKVPKKLLTLLVSRNRLKASVRRRILEVLRRRVIPKSEEA